MRHDAVCSGNNPGIQRGASVAGAAKPLKGLGSGVLEVASNYRGDTFRAVYTVRFQDRVYVLHAFQKKSKKGIATPQPDIAALKRRLALAVALHAAQEG